MLTIRENLFETMKGGNPDRFVKQYEFCELLYESPLPHLAMQPGKTVQDEWGITWQWPEGQLGPFPVHDEEHIVLKDIKNWRDYVHPPKVEHPKEVWQAAIDHANKVNKKEKFYSVFMAPGIFEMCHHLMGIENAMMAFYDAPECMHELIGFLVEYEMKMADQIVEHLHPNALFHHDDWGSQKSTFFAPEMFHKFLVQPYKKLYGYWKQNGVEIIVHHCDSYAATLVPGMIEMGIDIWQGVMSTNNTPELIKQYGPQITFMGDIDSGPVDNQDWSKEKLDAAFEKSCRRCGKHYFIPNLTQGGDYSSFPGVYEAANESIDKMSKKMF